MSKCSSTDRTTSRSDDPCAKHRPAFSLLEILVVMSIIALLMAVLLPTLSAARKRGKAARCLARLKDIGTATAAYAVDYSDRLPPAAIDWHPTQLQMMEVLGVDRCNLPYGYGWAELLYEHMQPKATVADWSQYPAQRNFEDKYGRYFNCPSAYEQVTHAGHFRVYLPGWAHDTYGVDAEGRMDHDLTRPRPRGYAAMVSRLQARWVLIGEGNEDSDQGDYLGDAVPANCSYVPLPPTRETSTIGLFGDRVGMVANQANTSLGFSPQTRDMPNRFAERHHDGGHYLFGDFHAEWSSNMREDLACDFDLDGVYDPGTEEEREYSGCSIPLPP